MPLGFGISYKVGGFILATIKILRVSHSSVLPDPVFVLCFNVFTFILLLARPFFQFSQTPIDWDSELNTSFLERDFHDFNVNRVKF